MLERAQSEHVKSSAAVEPAIEGSLQKVSAWIYPKLHQEIYTGRPTDFLGGCGDRLADCQQQRKLFDELFPTENGIVLHHHPELHDWCPSEWLVAGRLSDEPPIYDHSECGNTSSHSRLGMTSSHRPAHPEPIQIEGHPVRNSPFLHAPV